TPISTTRTTNTSTTISHATALTANLRSARINVRSARILTARRSANSAPRPQREPSTTRESTPHGERRIQLRLPASVTADPRLASAFGAEQASETARRSPGDTAGLERTRSSRTSRAPHSLAELSGTVTLGDE